VSHEPFFFLKQCFFALTRRISLDPECLAARLGFKRHFLTYLFHISKNLSLITVILKLKCHTGDVWKVPKSVTC